MDSAPHTHTWPLNNRVTLDMACYSPESQSDKLPMTQYLPPYETSPQQQASFDVEDGYLPSSMMEPSLGIHTPPISEYNGFVKADPCCSELQSPMSSTTTTPIDENVSCSQQGYFAIHSADYMDMEVSLRSPEGTQLYGAGDLSELDDDSFSDTSDWHPQATSNCELGQEIIDKPCIDIDFEMQFRDSSTVVHPCTFCSLAFSHVSKLRLHMQKSHRPHQCTACPRAFARKHDLHRHFRTHTGVKPYTCSSCNKGFARTDARQRHWRMDIQCEAKGRLELALRDVSSLTQRASPKQS